MALSAATVLECRIGGSDTNGGGFVTGATGTDWSQQTSTQYSVTDGVTAGSTTITSATAAFGTDVVGNLIYVSGGTGSVAANWYQIVTRTNSTTIVVDRSTGLTAGTGVTLHIGGALATPGAAGPIFAVGVNGMGCWVKYSASVYAITTTTAGASGPVSLPSAVACWMEGYDATRGDRTGNRPILQWQTAPGSVTYACVAVGGGRQVFSNLKVDGNTQNNAAGFNTSASRTNAIDCVAANCNGTGAVIGFLGAGNMALVRCQASSCTTGISTCNAIDCDAVSCGTGFGGGCATLVKCLARTCTSNGFASTSTTAAFFACTADSNTTAGFDVSGGIAALVGCIASNQSGGGGIGFKVGANLATLLNCTSYNNTTEINGTALVNEGMILNAAFTGGQPYVSAGSDFRPNATAGAGALLRGGGIGVFNQTDNADIGAVQHADPAGGPASSGCCSMP